ncbi:MAG TPA: hypothetical protein VGR25_09520 [bacterium]|jgi:hypothetical protein|nr:hypothetical protein [bacterium]
MLRLTRFAPWLIFAGNVALLSGLAWDARLHGLDPTLAMREGIFTMSNPGHILFAAGVALVVAGSVLLLLAQALRRSGSTLARRVVAVAASGALVALSALTFTATVAGQDGQAAGHVHSHAAPQMADGSGHQHPAPSALPVPGGSAAPTPDQQTAAERLLADVRRDAAAFADLNAAVAAGYVQSTRWSLLNWGAAHFTNFTYSRDGRHLDTQRPESLIYLKLPSGKVALLGVMFSAPKGEGPRPGGPLTDWHTHDNLCISATGAAVLAIAPGQCPAGAFFVGERVEMMHIWIFNNPEGPFAHPLSAEAFRAALRQFGGR